MPRVTRGKLRPDYKQFLQSLELVGIALVASRFHIDRRRFFEDKEEEIFVDFTSELSEGKQKTFEVHAKFALKCARSESAEGSLQLDADYLLHFHSARDATKELANQFASSEVRLVVWPYIREYVASMCGRAHVPPISLPLTGAKR